MSRRSAAAPRPKVNPHSIFLTAVEYHKASGRLFSIHQDEAEKAKTGGLIDNRFLFPQMILSVLASELYFKSLYGLQTGGQLSDNHDLSWFYNQLEPGRKATLRKHWDAVSQTDATFRALAENFPNVKLDIETCIKRSRNSFQNLRYRYEGRPPDFLICILPRVLLLSIREMQPEWDSAGPGGLVPISALPRKADGSYVGPHEVGDIPIQQLKG